MSKLPEKGILKKHGYGAVDGKDKWGDDSQSEQLEIGSQSDGQEPAGAVADMEYKFKVRITITTNRHKWSNVFLNLLYYKLSEHVRKLKHKCRRISCENI